MFHLLGKTVQCWQSNSLTKQSVQNDCPCRFRNSFLKESSMKIKTLAIVVLSALSLSSAAALADTTTVNGGTVHFKGKLLTPLAQLMQALLIKPFS